MNFCKNIFIKNPEKIIRGNNSEIFPSRSRRFRKIFQIITAHNMLIFIKKTLQKLSRRQNYKKLRPAKEIILKLRKTETSAERGKTAG